MVQTPQRAVALPAHEVVMHGAARGQVLGQGAPLAARAQDVEHGVEHLAPINPALPPRPALRDVYEGAGQVPFGVGHVTRITQALAVVGTARLLNSNADHGITTDSSDSTFCRTGSKHAEGLSGSGYALECLEAQALDLKHIADQTVSCLSNDDGV